MPIFNGTVVDSKVVVEVGLSDDVPGVAGHSARHEGVNVVNQVGDNDFHEFSWEPSDRGRTGGGSTRRVSIETLLEVIHASV